jgi:hypothetical protein
LLRYADLVARLWQSLVAAIVTSHPPVLPTLACSRGGTDKIIKNNLLILLFFQ